MSFRRHLPLYLGVFFIALSTIILEIALTRVFSVSLWYQFGFMIISTALLGFGASGSWLAVRRDAFKGDLYAKMSRSALWYGVSVLVAFFIMVHIPLDPLKPLLPDTANPQMATVELIFFMALYYTVIVIPFFFAGLTLGRALSAWSQDVGRLYFADLLGAGIGSFLVVLALYRFSGQQTVVIASIFGALSALSFAYGTTQRAQGRKQGVWTILAVILALVLVIMPYADSLFRLYIPPSKPLHIAYDKKHFPDIVLEYTGWTPFSRIDVMWQPGMKGQAWGLSGAYDGPLPEQKFITIDAAAMTAINNWSGDREELAWVNALPSSLVYRLQKKPNVLIIGPGGGVDPLVAYYNGPKKITAAEINPLIVDIMQNQYREFSGGLYSDIPEIDVHVAEGRNFVARSHDIYDVIQFSQVDTWAAAAAGAYSLTENYLYTQDAFRDYLNHLSDHGMLAIGRWYFDPPGQPLRLVTIGSAALGEIGVTDPSRHFIVVRAGDTATVVMKKSAYTPEEIARIREIAGPLYFDIIYAPDMLDEPDNPFVDFFNAEDKEAFYASYPLDVSPTNDDRPFFFEYYGWTNFGTFRSGKLTLMALLIQALLLSTLLIIWPLWRFRREGLSTKGTKRFLLYFIALGMGFIFIEIGLMQRLILFLGHPTFALSVVLFSLLVFSGVGSYLSSRLVPQGHDPRQALRWVIPALAALMVAYIFLLPPILQWGLGWSTPARILFATLLIAPLGLLMGMPFPLGFRLVSQVNQPLAPWAWGVNGFASVVGSILSVMLAQTIGFSLVMALAVMIYLAGLAAILSLRAVGVPAMTAGEGARSL